MSKKNFFFLLYFFCLSVFANNTEIDKVFVSVNYDSALEKRHIDLKKTIIQSIKALKNYHVIFLADNENSLNLAHKVNLLMINLYSYKNNQGLSLSVVFYPKDKTKKLSYKKKAVKLKNLNSLVSLSVKSIVYKD